MKFPYEWPVCILCCEKKPDSWEHLFPEGIGGRIQQNLLCKGCNSETGSRLISRIKTDPWIRKAAWRVRSQIPEIYRKIETHQRDLHITEGGIYFESAKNKKGRQILTKKAEKGGIVFDPFNPPKSMLKYLERHSINPKKLKAVAENGAGTTPDYDAAIVNEGQIEGIKTEFSYPSIVNTDADPRAFLLLVYEYFAIWAQESIYWEGFNWIRDCIRGGSIPHHCKAELFRRNNPQPVHRIQAEYSKPTLTVSIFFFNTCVRKVSFEVMIQNKEFPVIIEDLAENKVLYAESLEDAESSQYYVFES